MQPDAASSSQVADRARKAAPRHLRGGDVPAAAGAPRGHARGQPVHAPGSSRILARMTSIQDMETSVRTAESSGQAIPLRAERSVRGARLVRVSFTRVSKIDDPPAVVAPTAFLPIRLSMRDVFATSSGTTPSTLADTRGSREAVRSGDGVSPGRRPVHDRKRRPRHRASRLAQHPGTDGSRQKRTDRFHVRFQNVVAGGHRPSSCEAAAQASSPIWRSAPFNCFSCC